MTADARARAAHARHYYDVEVVDLLEAENTVGHAGGTVLPVDELRAVRKVADEAGVPVHLDGARIFNAAAATGVDAIEWTREVDDDDVLRLEGPRRADRLAALRPRGGDPRGAGA